MTMFVCEWKTIYAKGIKGQFILGEIYNWPILSAVTYQQAKKPWQNRSSDEHMYVPDKGNFVYQTSLIGRDLRTSEYPTSFHTG